MLEQAEDFRAESLALDALLRDVGPVRFAETTQFKDWTINDVLQHLHFWNQMAGLALHDETALLAIFAELFSGQATMREFERGRLDDLTGEALLDAWRGEVDAVADLYLETDPKRRLKWAGPDMSVRSAITARLMETWAHGQEIYDHVGVERKDTDRIRNIAHLGVTTFGWSFLVRDRTPPAASPYIRLTAPSGAIWEWGTPSDSERVEGDATGFCQVVTQTRNLAESGLTVVGDSAREWMSHAQCFAGPPETPPAPGARFRRARHGRPI